MGTRAMKKNQENTPEQRIKGQAPGEMEMLLPWHAAGTLNACDARRIEEALARDPKLAKRYAAMREECAEIVYLNESLDVPSARVLRKLLAAMKGEPPRHRPAGLLSKSQHQEKQRKSRSI